jgi:hypothetical protein
LIEALTHKLNLNLTAIILHNSCPRLKLTLSQQAKAASFNPTLPALPPPSTAATSITSNLLMRSVSRNPTTAAEQHAAEQFKHLIAHNINQTRSGGTSTSTITNNSQLAAALSSASTLIQSTTESSVSMYNLNSFYTVLNQSDINCCSRKRPHEFVRDLLLRLLKYCKTHLPRGAHSIDVSTAREIYQCAEFKTITNESQELQHLNLNSLKTENQKLSFFINLHNLLSIHAHFYMTALQSQRQQSPTSSRPTLEKPIVLNENNLANNGDATMSATMFSTKAEKLLFEQRMCYRVGQMGYVSLYDLKHVILTRKCMNNDSFANLNFASISKSVEVSKSPPPSLMLPSPRSSIVEQQNETELYKMAYYTIDLDSEPLWAPYLPRDASCGYKILFALTDCVESDPPVCVFNADELLGEQLLMHMQLFLNDSVYANLSEDALYLPNFLVENCSFFIETESGQATTNKLLPFIVAVDTSSTKNDLDCLVRFLMDHVNQKLKDSLKSICFLLTIQQKGSSGQNLLFFKKYHSLNFG